jgi:GTPase
MRLFALWALVVTLSPGTVTARRGEFRMTVMDVFTIGDSRAVVMTGIVEGGPVSVNDVVCLRPDGGEPRELTIQEISVLQRQVDTAEPGMIPGLMFEGIERTDAKAGDTLTAGCG